MTEPVIRAERISKRYRLGTELGYKTIRESITAGAGRLVGARSRERDDGRYIWALRDVSFEINRGEVVGIIGLNGAGKSTILKILSRVTRPTSGWAEIRGRVGSLLEVGTGFHPELTGRENIYLNGVILGMSKTEIQRRFDEIVDFADIEGFLDTPVKRYSSGMQVRLAFAVAAHVEPEILIVDEVLAVGDLAFQKKCLGKLGEVTGEGRTVLFVSHNMSLILALCRRGVLLEHGAVVEDGPVEETAGRYLRRLEEIGAASLLDRTDRRGWQQAVLTGVEIVGDDAAAGRLVTGDGARFVFHVSTALSRMSCAFTILNHVGQPLMSFESAPPTGEDEEDPALDRTFVCEVDELLLVPGRYRLDATIRGRNHLQDQIEGAAFFDVEEGTVRGRPIPAAPQGEALLPHRWRHPNW